MGRDIIGIKEELTNLGISQSLEENPTYIQYATLIYDASLASKIFLYMQTLLAMSDSESEHDSEEGYTSDDSYGRHEVGPQGVI